MARVLTQQKNQESNVALRGQHAPLDLFRRQFDALLDSLSSGLFAPAGQDYGSNGLPGLGVTENDKEIVVRAGMPGFEENELDVRLEQNTLTIKAEKEQKSDNQQEYRSFFRTVTLPSGIDPDKVQAAYRNGVLELHIPRTEASQARRIPLQGQKPPAGQPPAAKQTGNGKQGAQAKSETAKT
jgi:HSP20 family protein